MRDVIIDAHVHWGEGLFTAPSDVDTFISDMDQNDIEMSLLLPLDGLRLSHDYQVANDSVANVVALRPDRFAGLATIHPRWVDTAVSEMKRCLTEKNLIGVKFHPWLQSFCPLEDCFMDVAAEANKLQTLFFFHDGTPPYSAPFQIAEVARRYPDLTIIMGHSGLNDMWRESLLAAKRYENIWLCYCGTSFWGMKEIAESLNGERIVWGSDYPLANRRDTRERIHQVEVLPVKDTIKERILYENGKALIERFTGRNGRKA